MNTQLEMNTQLKRVYTLDNDMLTTVLMALFDASRTAQAESERSTTQKDFYQQWAEKYQAAEAWFNAYDNWEIVFEPELNGAASPSAG